VFKAIRSPRAIHPGTHGFYLPYSPPAPGELLPPLRADFPATSGLDRLSHLENALLRSGFVLAGANKVTEIPAKDVREDGWVMAEEIALMDFTGRVGSGRPVPTSPGATARRILSLIPPVQVGPTESSWFATLSLPATGMPRLPRRLQRWRHRGHSEFLSDIQNRLNASGYRVGGISTPAKDYGAFTHETSWRSTLASRKSTVSNPSVNQP
jgi:hypothetical protein